MSNAMSDEAHLSDEQLLAFSNGCIAENEAALLECHLESCPMCIGRISELDVSDDGLIKHLHRALKVKALNEGRLTEFLIDARFRLHSIIGRGAMGTVWQAEQIEPIHRDVAVKLIHAGGVAPDAAGRFEAECQALALMDHPSIARVYEAGTFRTNDGTPLSYIAMELVRGVPITEYCHIHGLDLQSRLELFTSVCFAIQHAHQKGIIHRDIKPSNVLVTEIDGRPFAKVIDFGIAKAIQRDGQRAIAETLSGSIIGTPEYMSPEQAGFQNQDVDSRCDVYALGALLYTLLTGSSPIGQSESSSANLQEVLRTIREDDPPRPSLVLRGKGRAAPVAGELVRGDLDSITLQALQKDRERRYGTAIALAEDVGRFLRGDPVCAVAPSARYRIGKFVRKHQGVVVAASLLLIVLLTGVIGTSIGFVRATAERQRAQDAEADTHRQSKSANDARARAELAASNERQARVALSANHVAMLSNFINLVSAHRSGQPGAFEKAIAHRVWEIEQWIDQARIDDPQQNYVLHSSASDALQWLDEVPRAIVQAKKALTIASESFGPHDATTVNAYFRLAELHRLARDPVAEADYRHRGQSAFAAMPLPTTPREREALAALMWYCREWINESGHAIVVAERLLADARRRGEALEAIQYQEALAWALQRNGRIDDAVREQRLVLASARTAAELGHLRALVMNAQQLLINANRFDDELFAHIRQVLGPEHVHHSLLAIAGAQRIRERQWTEAEALLRQCLAIRQTHQPDEWITFNAMSLLGGSLLGQSRYEEAEPLLVAGLRGLRERSEKIPAPARVRIVEAAQRLVELYHRLDRPDEAARWQTLIPPSP